MYRHSDLGEKNKNKKTELDSKPERGRVCKGDCQGPIQSACDNQMALPPGTVLHGRDWQ